MAPTASPAARIGRAVTATAAILAAASSLSSVNAQQHDSVIWHNRYHAILAMAAYGDWETLCPTQTFTQEGLLSNFPNSTEQPWTVLDRFGPTAHGAEGWTAFIPEMNKVTFIFKGDYNIEKNLPQETASLAPFGLENECGPDCRANAFALAGYMEAYQETNGFENAMAKWREVKETSPDFYASSTGHGLGGMHSILATIHLGSQGVVTFSHNYGAPRTLNPAAAAYHNFILGGDQLDRGAGNADIFMTFIPASDEYAHVNTGVWYHGWDDEFKMQTNFCYEEPESHYCLPQGDLNELDHYFYFSNVGQCGGSARQNTAVAAQYIAEQQARIGEMRIPSVEERNAVISQTLGLALGTAVAPPNPRSTAVSSSAAPSTAAASTATGASSAPATTATGSNRAIGAAGNAAQNTSGISSDTAQGAKASDTGAGSRLTFSFAVLSGSLIAGLALF